MVKPKKFYVTTPIYYATAAPHLGTLYSTILADFVARFHVLQGDELFFLTGTDEFGQKVMQAASDVGKDPQNFVDQFIPIYKNLWKQYYIDYTKFIRTTDDDHVKGVQKWLKQLQHTGDIYKGTYKGWYCTPCETFLTPKDYKKTDTHTVCPLCDRVTVWMEEPCYFFKLSLYQEKLLAFYRDHPNFIVPRERYAEVISFVKEGLEDLSISRTTLSWGVPFPDDSSHVAYVWADALNNYLTGIGYGSNEELFKKWWPADLHVIGKDIIRFHAVYWPAFLMASGLDLPQCLLVHGWIRVGEHKMSKSRDNIINPTKLADTFGADEVRYYLVRQFSISHDGQFDVDDLIQKTNAYLSDDLGNLLHRVVALASKHHMMTVKPGIWGEKEQALYAESIKMLDQYRQHVQTGYYDRALATVSEFIGNINAYVHISEPWVIINDNRVAFNVIMSASCHALRSAGLLLWPVMPSKMEELFIRIGYTFSTKNNSLDEISKPWQDTFVLHKGNPLFTKHEVGSGDIQGESDKKPQIDIKDVLKLEILVGMITACEVLDDSDKLLKLKVDFGKKGTKQILAGIKKFYRPEELEGKQGVFVVNMKTRTMMGFESQGMLLCAETDDGSFCFITPEKSAQIGSKVK